MVHLTYMRICRLVTEDDLGLFEVEITIDDSSIALLQICFSSFSLAFSSPLSLCSDTQFSRSTEDLHFGVSLVVIQEFSLLFLRRHTVTNLLILVHDFHVVGNEPDFSTRGCSSSQSKITKVIIEPESTSTTMVEFYQDEG